MIGNILSFYGKELFTSRPTSTPEDHPLSVVRDCLFNTFAATLHLWKQFLHPQPDDAPCRGDRDPLVTDIYIYTYIHTHIHSSYICRTNTLLKIMNITLFESNSNFKKWHSTLVFWKPYFKVFPSTNSALPLVTPSHESFNSKRTKHVKHILEIKICIVWPTDVYCRCVLKNTYIK